MSEISNHAGLCPTCRKWADKITKHHPIAQLEIGVWAIRRRHKEVHVELRERAIALDNIEKSASLDRWTAKDDDIGAST